MPLLAVLLARTALAAIGPEPGGSGAPVPALAGETSGAGGGFRLGLEVALATRSPPAPDLGTVAPPQAESPPIVASTTLGLAEVRSIAAKIAMRRQTPEPASAPPPSDGGFGHWLKRHWWVPVLVGAAVLATAGESLYDDDDDDDED